MITLAPLTFVVLVLGLPLVSALVLAGGMLLYHRASRGECPIPSVRDVKVAFAKPEEGEEPVEAKPKPLPKLRI